MLNSTMECVASTHRQHAHRRWEMATTRRRTTPSVHPAGFPLPLSAQFATGVGTIGVHDQISFNPDLPSRPVCLADWTLSGAVQQCQAVECVGCVCLSCGQSESSPQVHAQSVPGDDGHDRRRHGPRFGGCPVLSRTAARAGADDDVVLLGRLWRRALNVRRQAQGAIVTVEGPGEELVQKASHTTFADQDGYVAGDKARKTYEAAMKCHQMVGSDMGRANARGNLGNLCLQTGDLEQALSHHRVALAIHEQTGNPVGRANALSNIGNVRLREQKFDEARKLYLELGVRSHGAKAVEELIERLGGSRAQKVKDAKDAVAQADAEDADTGSADAGSAS
ncbi:MAG TPA: tetratricopeptide repeat protein [Candidatus Handelsmanbacteria bacterium]|nr:tetratricopeptide repeat protein [Candidatus Handelsmanbacteria bacterium]